MSPGKYFYRASAGLLTAGVLFGTAGVKGVMKFLDNTGSYRTMTTGQYALRVLVPHIFLLTGIAFVVFGILMLVKGVLFNREHADD